MDDANSMMRQQTVVALIAGAALWAAPAIAQSTASGGIELSTAEMRRGLDWSGGRASGSADASAMVGPLDLSARVASTRRSARNGRSDAVVDLVLGKDWDVGDVRLRLSATGHLFVDAKAGMDYFETAASASYSYGPVQLTGGMVFAPPQDNIGGSNLYVHASADAGIPGTPFSLVADIGHSSGRVDGPIRAQRLRPGGDYTNWRLGIEWRGDRLILGIDYTGTDVGRDHLGPFDDKADANDRIVGRARFTFR